MLTVLGIETSCDETSVAILKDKILSNVVISQSIHSKFGGVVPELASREHLNNFLPILNESLQKSKLTMEDIDLISVTIGPGLAGSLIVGLSYAKALSILYKKPLIGVNHIEGHIFSLMIEHSIKLKMPILILIVSGGHTELVIMEELFRYKVLGITRDDACGEAFDKVAKLLNLPYPGGPHIDNLAKETMDKIEFTIYKTDSFDFSYSGLKTAVKYHLKKEKYNNIKKIAAGFQYSAIEQLIDRVERAAKKYNIKYLGVVGGVSANSYLRKRVMELKGSLFKEVLLPDLRYSVDNGAMIAVLGKERYQKYGTSSLKIGINPSLKLGET